MRPAMGRTGSRAALAIAVLLLAALPPAAATTYDAKLVALAVDGLKDLPTNYEFKAQGDLKTYTVTGRVATVDGRVFLNVTSPANVRTSDDSRLSLEYPVSWTQKGFANDTKPRSEVESARVSFALGRLPADPPTGPVSVKAMVEKTMFTLRILPADPILVLDVPAADGIAYVDVANGAAIPVRTLYYPDGDRLTGPGFLGGKALGMPGSTDIRMNGKTELKPAADVACGLHAMSVASVKVKGTSTGTGTIYAGKSGPVEAVAVLRAPSVSFPAGFVTDVAPAEISLKCFPPQSRVQILWAPTPTDEMRPLATFTVADSGGLDEFVTFPSLDGRTNVAVQARVVQGPAVLSLGKYTANATATVKDVASSEELNLVVDASLDKSLYDIGDTAAVTGSVVLAGKPATGVDVTVVWPFEDTASAREDRLQARTIRTDSSGDFSTSFVVSPTGQGASMSPGSTGGERLVLVTARKVGLNTGVDRVLLLSTGLAPIKVTDVKWRPEVVQPGASTTVSGRISVPTSVAAVPGILEAATVEIRIDPLAEPVVGRTSFDGGFSVPVTLPADVAAGAYPTTVVVYGRAPEAVGGVLLAPGLGAGTLKVGSIDAKPEGRDQRVTVKSTQSLGADAVAVTVVRAGAATPAANGAEILHGDRVAAAPGSEAVLELADQGVTATVGNATRVDLAVSRADAAGARTALLLHAPGELRLDAGDAAPSGARSFVVLTRFHEVTVADADAVVRTTADGGLDLEVWKGTATVVAREGGPSLSVAAGKRLAVAGDTALSEVAATDLAGANPFTAPPPEDDAPDAGADDPAPARTEGEGGKTPSPWFGAVVGALAVAALARSRRRS